MKAKSLCFSVSFWKQVGHGAWRPRQPLRGWNCDGKRDGSSGAGGLPPIPLVHVQRTGTEEIHPVSLSRWYQGGVQSRGAGMQSGQKNGRIMTKIAACHTPGTRGARVFMLNKREWLHGNLQLLNLTGILRRIMSNRKKFLCQSHPTAQS